MSECHIIRETSAYRAIFSSFCKQEFPIEACHKHLSYEQIQNKEKLDACVCVHCVDEAVKLSQYTAADVKKKMKFLSVKEKEMEDICQQLKQLKTA